MRSLSLKKLFTLVLASAFLLAVVGCTTESPTTNDSGNGEGDNANDQKITIGLSISTLNNPFFVTLKEGAESAAAEHGADIVVVDAQNDPAKQVADIEDLIQQGVNVILVNPTDGAAVVSAIEAANNANIPIITVDRGADGGKIAAHVASDNVAGGVMAGEYILELISNKGKVVELEGIPGTSAARDRGKGFNQAIDGASDVEVVAKQPADFDRAKGLTVMENILTSNAEIDAVFAHNDEMALGALQAIEAAGRDDIQVVGFDATDDAVAAVEEGRLAATVAQQPALIGEIALNTAIKIVNGEEVEAVIPVDLELVK